MSKQSISTSILKIYSHGNVHHSYSKELTMSWSRSVWLFCLDITYGQSRGDTYSIMSLSDWTICHGQTYVYMAWTWHVALSNIKASCKLTTISHPVIDSSDIFLSLLLSLQRVHCSHVWVWVMHVGSVDVRVMILQYRRWSLYTTCPSYTHAYKFTQFTGLLWVIGIDSNIEVIVVSLSQALNETTMTEIEVSISILSWWN